MNGSAISTSGRVKRDVGKERAMRATPRVTCTRWTNLRGIPVAGEEALVPAAVPLSVLREAGTTEQKHAMECEACAERVVFLRRAIEDVRRTAERLQHCGAGGLN
jgi:hypothetical protein